MPDAVNNSMYKKMMRANDHINERLADLRGTAAKGWLNKSLNRSDSCLMAIFNLGGEKEKASASSSKGTPYDAVNGALDAFGSKEVDEVFTIPFGVQLFMIEVILY